MFCKNRVAGNAVSPPPSPSLRLASQSGSFAKGIGMLGSLYKASENGELDIVKSLINGGANVNQREGPWVETPLFVAASGGYTNIVEILINNGAEINQTNNSNLNSGRGSPLYIACRNGHADVVGILIVAGADVNQENINGWSLLYIASRYGHAEVARILIDHNNGNGVVNMENRSGETPLFIASLNGYFEVVKILLDNGADVNKSNMFSQSPLFAASSNGRAEMVEFLIDKKADINQPNNWKETPLYIAARQGHANVVKTLVYHEADINKSDNDGESPLFTAIEHANLEVIKLLAKKGAEVNWSVVYKTIDEKTKKYLQKYCHIYKVKSIVDNEEIVYEIIHKNTTKSSRSNLMIIGPSGSGSRCFSRIIRGLNLEVALNIGFTKPDKNCVFLSTDDSIARFNATVDSDYAQSRLNSAVAEIFLSNNSPSYLEKTFEKSKKQKSCISNSFCNGGNQQVSSAVVTRDYPSNDISSNLGIKNIVSNVQVTLEYDMIMKSQEIIKENSEKNSSGVILTIYDFSEVSLFDIVHHFHLTSYGVYTLVFSMEWLLQVDPATSLFEVRSLSHPQLKHCIEYLKYWMNAIHAHCKLMRLNQSDVKDRSPPVLLVGTGKDIISDNEAHKIISNLLCDQLNKTGAWISLEHNKVSDDVSDVNDLNFFPVNNQDDINDDTFGKIVQLVSRIIKNKPYIERQIPLSWMQLIDHLNILNKRYNKSFIKMAELISIAKIYDINEAIIPEILEMCNEMRYFLWSKELIILDPILYLINPITNIIYSQLDFSALLRSVSSRHDVSERNRLASKGIASFSLISDILKTNPSQLNTDEQISVAIMLMVKYGLIVEINPHYDIMNGTIIEDNIESDMNKKLFLFPSFIPVASGDIRSTMIEQWSTRQSKHVIYFIFTTCEEFVEKKFIPLSLLPKISFFPVGFFHRLVGKALTWCNEINYLSDLSRQIVHGDTIELTFINQSFVVQFIPDHNCLEVMIAGENPLAIRRRLKKHINEIINECFPNLHVIEALAHPNGLLMSNSSAHSESGLIPSSSLDTTIASNSSAHSESGLIPSSSLDTTIASNSSAHSESGLIPSSSLEKTIASNSSAHSESGLIPSLSLDTTIADNLSIQINSSRIIEHNVLRSTYCNWLPQSRDAPYDVFISYRWNVVHELAGNVMKDQDLARKLYDILSLFNQPNTSQVLRVFRDEKILEKGDNLKIRFSSALLRSKLFVPIISSNAVQRLLKHDVTIVDNMLIEWLIAVELCIHHRKNPHVNLKIIYPIFVNNEVEEKVSFSRIQRRGSSVRLSSFSVGDYVKANYYNEGSWFTGVIKNDRGDGTYDIQYDGCDLLMRKCGWFRKGGVLDRLPNIIPIATINIAASLLEDKGIQLSSSFKTMTVKGVVDGFKEYLYVDRWDYDRRECKICKGILKVLENLNNENSTTHEVLSSDRVRGIFTSSISSVDIERNYIVENRNNGNVDYVNEIQL
eukprot:gene4796-6723_t